MHSKHACQVGPLINQEIFLGCTKGRVRVTEEIVMQQQGNDDRDGDDASYDTCMLLMTDVNVIHASIRCDDPSYEIGNSRTGYLGEGERCCWCTSKTLLR